MESLRDYRSVLFGFDRAIDNLPVVMSRRRLSVALCSNARNSDTQAPAKSVGREHGIYSFNEDGAGTIVRRLTRTDGAAVFPCSNEPLERLHEGWPRFANYTNGHRSPT